MKQNISTGLNSNIDNKVKQIKSCIRKNHKVLDHNFDLHMNLTNQSQNDVTNKIT